MSGYIKPEGVGVYDYILLVWMGRNIACSVPLLLLVYNLVKILSRGTTEGIEEMTVKINLEVAKKVLKTVDAGLSKGLGNPKPGEMCVEAAVCYALGLDHGDDPSCVSRAVRALKIQLNDIDWSSKAARAKGMRRLALIQLGSAGVIDDVLFSKKVVEYTIRTIIPIALRAAANCQKDMKHKVALEGAAKLCEKEGSGSAAARVAMAATRAAKAAGAAEAEWAEWAAGAAGAAAAAAAWAESAARAARTEWAAESAAKAAWAARDVTAKAASASSGSPNNNVLSDFAEGIVQILIGMSAPGAQWLYLTED